MMCPDCKEETKLSWDENFGQMFICKNGHAYIHDFKIDSPIDSETSESDLGLPPIKTEKDGGQLS